MRSEHLWCPMHGWHDAGQCPDMIVAAGIITGGDATVLTTEEN